MQQKWLILTSVACGTFMATLDSSIVNVALPTITNSFQTGLSSSRWVVISYLFSITGLLLFFGKLADVVGRKLVFNTGFVLFTLGSVLCGMSHTIGQLIAFRGLQGFGAAMLMANGPAIITAAFPTNERGKALGTLAMVVSLGLAVGPFLGGILVRLFTWPSIFFVNVPFGILGTVLVHRYVPATLGNSIAEAEILERERRLPFFVRFQIYFGRLRYFDWLGAILWMFVQLGYSLAIDQHNTLGLAGPLQRMISFSAAGLFILFIVWEWSVKDPILDLSVFRSRQFLTANISGFFSFVAISSVTLLMPFYFQSVRGLPPHKVGLLMTAIPLTIFFVAPVSGRLSDTYGARILSSVGMLIICGALILLSLPWRGLLSIDTAALAFYLILVGAGIGLFQSPNNNALMSAVSRSHLGIASALLATVRNFGMVTGAALSTGLLMHFYGNQTSLHPNSSPIDNFILALRGTFLSIGLICSVGIVTCMFRGNGRKGPASDEN